MNGEAWLMFDSVLGNVRDLMLEGFTDCSNTEFAVRYWIRFDEINELKTHLIDLLTPLESITRARRHLINLANPIKRCLLREHWVNAFIPSSERLSVVAAQEVKYREALS